MFSWEREQSSTFSCQTKDSCPWSNHPVRLQTNIHTPNSLAASAVMQHNTNFSKLLTPFSSFYIAKMDISSNLCGLHGNLQFYKYKKETNLSNQFFELQFYQTYKFPQFSIKNYEGYFIKFCVFSKCMNFILTDKYFL